MSRILFKLLASVTWTALLTITILPELCDAEEYIDLSGATVVVRPGTLANAEHAAATVLVEEIKARSGIQLRTSTSWPEQGVVIAITTGEIPDDWSDKAPSRIGANNPGTRPEGFQLFTEDADHIWILGADARGTLYGVGALLRNLLWAEDRAQLATAIDIATAPEYPIRGHQLGYRARANSWDAWTPAQFDQYIRELTFFGVNSIENIPFQDDREGALMKISRREMNTKMSEICRRYGLDYWVWTPADFDLSDQSVRDAALDKHEQLYRDCAELTGVFFPGGDPGHNPPELVLPFLEDISRRLLPIHPEAKIWLSLQWFNAKHVAEIISYLEEESPDWFGGFVAGPSSPPIPYTRGILPEKYRFRLYPDITHNKLSQYEVPWWDQAYALTLGREAINPRPAQYAMIHNWFAPFSDGFITYSDGVHDDINKTIWSALGWDSTQDIRKVLSDYCRVYFGPKTVDEAVDGILALEKNWRGSLRDNGAVEGTLLQWQQLQKSESSLASNWRGQMCLVRAAYDAYIRRRLLHETTLEKHANTILATCRQRGAENVMTQASALLSSAAEQPIAPSLRARIFELCDMLYESCSLQTSVSKYHASGAERGAFLDFVDYPMNNRWWLEDEFTAIRDLPTEEAKCERLMQIATWETPGPGSYYDDIGNGARSPHVLRSEEVFTQPGEEAQPSPTHWWWENGMSRERLSWQTSMNWPRAVVYDGLDPNAEYLIRLTGYGQSLLRVDDVRVKPAKDGKEIGEFKEFHVPARALEDRKIIVTWDRPTDEAHLNWRQRSRISEIWLLKQ